MVLGAGTSVTSASLLVVVGAIVGLLPAVIVERIRANDARLSRTRDLVLDRATDFARAARRLRARSEAYRDDPSDVVLQSIVTAHEDLWVAFECLVVVAGIDVQEAAREVLHHAWSVRAQYVDGVDPRAERYPGTSPTDRLVASLRPYYVAVRRDLGVPEPDHMYVER